MIGKRRVGPAARALVVVVCIAVAVAVFGGCGSDPNGQSGRGSQNFPQVSDGGLFFTPADLAAIGYKTSKQYSVDGLRGATNAVFGFWAPPDRDPIDYEVRFYASHTDAVNLGSALAEEGTGPDAALTAERATYKEGVNDRDRPYSQRGRSKVR